MVNEFPNAASTRAAAYRAQAEALEARAADLSDPGQKNAMQGVAKEWRRLAAQLDPKT